MVRLHVKKGDDNQFLYDTDVEANVDDVISDIVVIYNGRLKISRICYGKFIMYSLQWQVTSNIKKIELNIQLRNFELFRLL